MAPRKTDVLDPPETETPETEAPAESNGKRKYVRKVLTPPPVDALVTEDVPEDEWASHPLTATGAERDPAQKIIDDHVVAAYKAWSEAGKPDVRRSPRKRFAVQPDHAPAIRAMLAKAATLHGVTVKLSPSAHDQHGREIIVFSARDKAERKPREPKPETETVTETGEDS
jgi:hypothetical protein